MNINNLKKEGTLSGTIRAILDFINKEQNKDQFFTARELVEMLKLNYKRSDILKRSLSVHLPKENYYKIKSKNLNVFGNAKVIEEVKEWDRNELRKHRS